MAAKLLKNYSLMFTVVPTDEPPIGANENWRASRKQRALLEQRRVDLIRIVETADRPSVKGYMRLDRDGADVVRVELSRGGKLTLFSVVPEDCSPEELLRAYDDFFAPHGFRVVT